MKKHKKPDNSIRVFQDEKLKNNIEIKQIEWTPKQKQFIEIALSKETKLIFLSAPAGVGKTLLSTYIGLELLNQRKVSDIIYVRSAVESADNKLGYLPGEASEKMEVYAQPLFNKLEELLNKNDIHKLISENKVSVMPPNFCRGLNWNAKFISLDEGQNFSQKELVTLITRIGKFSKCIISADPSQSDINGKSGGFEKLRKLFDDDESKSQGIYSFEFTEDDIMRSELVKFLVKRLKNLDKK